MLAVEAESAGVGEEAAGADTSHQEHTANASPTAGSPGPGRRRKTTPATVSSPSISRLGAQGPDPAVRLAPAVDDFLDVATDHRPDGAREPSPRERWDGCCVDEAGQHVVL
jgi:hypothetical protein